MPTLKLFYYVDLQKVVYEQCVSQQTFPNCGMYAIAFAFYCCQHVNKAGKCKILGKEKQIFLNKKKWKGMLPRNTNKKRKIQNRLEYDKHKNSKRKKNRDTEQRITKIKER